MTLRKTLSGRLFPTAFTASMTITVMSALETALIRLASQSRQSPTGGSVKRYPQAARLLILADAGGSNSCRSRVWKARLQEQLCDTCGLAVTVCHYPSGCSKWNPIEHRLFSHISLNWASGSLMTRCNA